ncbi:hypothetical protein ACTGJ9_017210 [Bradyrhizobium sp. RDM12]
MKFSRIALVLAVLVPYVAFAQAEAAVEPGADSPAAARVALPLQVLQAQLRHPQEQEELATLLPERTEVGRPGQRLQETPD